MNSLLDKKGKWSSILLKILFLSILTSCAHHRDVRPGADGANKVVLLNETKNFDGGDALSQAEHYCKEIGKRPAIMTEVNQYVGSMDEQSYNNLKTGAKVAQTAGSMGYVFGGKKESDVGGVVGLGGVVADQVAGEGYRYEMTFKCQ